MYSLPCVLLATPLSVILPLCFIIVNLSLFLPSWYISAMKRRRKSKMTMARVYLVRHGETDSNKKDIIQGRLDVPLNETGFEQAERTAETLKGVKFVAAYGSSLKRAAKTAEIILAKQASNTSLTICEGLDQRYFGNLQGEKRKQESTSEMDVPDNAETFEEFSARTIEWWERTVVRQYLRSTIAATASREGAVRDDDKTHEMNILVVSHGGVIRTMVQSLVEDGKIQAGDGVKIGRCPNTSVTVIEVDELGMGEIVQYADNLTHLDN